MRGIDEQDYEFVAVENSDQALYPQDPEPCVSERSRRSLTLREIENGVLAANYQHAHVWVWNGKEEQARQSRLLVHREAGASEISHYYLSNAPWEIPWQKLARAQRFLIEHSFREANEAKNEDCLFEYQAPRRDVSHR